MQKSFAFVKQEYARFYNAYNFDPIEYIPKDILDILNKLGSMPYETLWDMLKPNNVVSLSQDKGLISGYLIGNFPEVIIWQSQKGFLSYEDYKTLVADRITNKLNSLGIHSIYYTGVIRITYTKSTASALRFGKLCLLMDLLRFPSVKYVISVGQDGVKSIYGSAKTFSSLGNTQQC